MKIDAKQKESEKYEKEQRVRKIEYNEDVNENPNE